MKKILLTRAGYERFLKELALLSQVERPHAVHDILEASPLRGWDRDADLQSRLAQRRKVERRLHEVQEILANAEVLMGSNLPPDRVRFAAWVRLLNLATGKEQEFTLVGPVEADASQGHLSVASPLGRALLGRSLGDRVDLTTPSGLRTYQILEIRMDGL